MTQHVELPRDVASLEPLFAVLDDGFRDHDIDDRTSYCVKLAAEELFTNMVRHNVGGGDAISVSLDISAERIRLDLVDHEVEPFDPKSVPAAAIDAAVEDRQPGGLGMHLVRSLVDRVSYRSDAGKLRVSVTKKLGG